MSDYTVYAQANPGTDYPVKDAQLRAQLTLDSDKIDYAASGYGFGYRRNATSGLTAGYYGGVIISGGSLTTIADGTILLTASQTNYVERTAAGVVSKNTSGFTAGKIPMFTATTNTTDVTAVVDKRQRNVFGDLVAVGSLTVTSTITASGDITRTESNSANYSKLILKNTGGAAQEWNLIAGGSASAYPQQLVIQNVTGGINSVILDTAGNVGIGSSPSAWYSPSRAFQAGNGAAVEGRNNYYPYISISSNWYIDSAGTPKYINGSATAAARYVQDAGGHTWYTAAAGTGAISAITQMVLDASGALYSAAGNHTQNNGTTETIAAMPANGTYLAFVKQSGAGTGGIRAIALVTAGSSSIVADVLTAAGGVTFAVSGMNLQIANTAGGTLVSSWAYIKLNGNQ